MGPATPFYTFLFSFSPFLKNLWRGSKWEPSWKVKAFLETSFSSQTQNYYELLCYIVYSVTMMSKWIMVRNMQWKWQRPDVCFQSSENTLLVYWFVLLMLCISLPPLNRMSNLFTSATHLPMQVFWAQWVTTLLAASWLAWWTPAWGTVVLAVILHRKMQ